MQPQLACEVLRSLMVEERFKVHARRLGVIPDLVKLLRLPPVGEVTCAVGNTLASIVEGVADNRREFRKNLGMRPLCRLLQAGPLEPVTIAACKLIESLAVEKENKVLPQLWVKAPLPPCLPLSRT